jgi:hypothetical protein
MHWHGIIYLNITNNDHFKQASLNSKELRLRYDKVADDDLLGDNFCSESSLN